MVGYYWPCPSRMASGTRIVPMLVQSCLDAFLAVIVEVKDSLRASPRVLFRCVFSSRPTSRSSPAPVPLDSTLSSLGPRAARPASRLFFRAHVPFVFLYLLRRPRAESLPFVLLHFYITMSLHNWYYVRCHLQVCRELNVIS